VIVFGIDWQSYEAGIREKVIEWMVPKNLLGWQRQADAIGGGYAERVKSGFVARPPHRAESLDKPLPSLTGGGAGRDATSPPVVGVAAMRGFAMNVAAAGRFARVVLIRALDTTGPRSSMLSLMLPNSC